MFNQAITTTQNNNPPSTPQSHVIGASTVLKTGPDWPVRPKKPVQSSPVKRLKIDQKPKILKKPV